MELPDLINIPSHIDPETRFLAEQARSLTIQDDQSAETCRHLLDAVKIGIKEKDQERREAIAPIREAMERIEAPIRDAIAILRQAQARLEAALRTYLLQRRREEEERRRQALEDYQRQRREQEARAAQARAEQEAAERRAQEAREAAARAADEAERRRRLAEAARAAQQSERAEAKVQEAMSTAISLAPHVPEERTAEVLGSWRQDYEPQWSNGLPFDEDYHRDDERFAFLPDRYWVVDRKRIRQDVKRGIRIEGVIAVPTPRSVTRRKR